HGEWFVVGAFLDLPQPLHGRGVAEISRDAVDGFRGENDQAAFFNDLRAIGNLIQLGKMLVDFYDFCLQEIFVLRIFWRCFSLKSSSFLVRASSARLKMRTANSPAFLEPPLPMATPATGTPGGI